jgi:hypothetical protein
VINHGVDPAVMEEMKKQVEEFLALPVAERTPGGIHKGVASQGYGTGYVKPDTGARDWRDYFLLRTYPESMRDYSTWPRSPSFRYRFIITILLSNSSLLGESHHILTVAHDVSESSNFSAPLSEAHVSSHSRSTCLKPSRPMPRLRGLAGVFAHVTSEEERSPDPMRSLID